jgi:hypothetical protein
MVLPIVLDRTQPLLPMRPGQVERRTRDNYGTHKTALIRAWLAKRSRFHFTPTGHQFSEVIHNCLRWCATFDVWCIPARSMGDPLRERCTQFKERFE